MRTVILNRPKSIEKYYDETKYKIFINGTFVAKLKRGEPLELKVEDDVIDIQAKVAYWGSRIERIELSDEITEIDIARNPKFPYNNSPLMYLFVFLAVLIQFLRLAGKWGTWLIVVVIAAYVLFVIKYDIINRHNYILIKKTNPQFSRMG